MDRLNELENTANRSADNFEPETVVNTKDILVVVQVFRELKQRAEAAEVQLAELTKQKPVAEVNHDGTFYGFKALENMPEGNYQLFTRVAPATLPVDEETERAKFEDFTRKHFAETMDHRRSINGDQSYMAWDKGVAWLTWKQRAGLK